MRAIFKTFLTDYAFKKWWWHVSSVSSVNYIYAVIPSSTKYYQYYTKLAHSQINIIRVMVLTIAMTAAPAPASAHTNRWKVKSSCNTQESFVLSFDYTDVCLDIRHELLCLRLTSNIKSIINTSHAPCFISPHWSHTCWRTLQILCTPSSPQRWSQLLININKTKKSSLNHISHPYFTRRLILSILFSCIQLKLTD